MINYTLKCSNDHRFDSWFKSADAFDKLKGANMVTCTTCGDTQVEKAMMAPRVRPARSAAVKPSEKPVNAEPAAPEPTSLTQPATKAEAALAKLRKQVEENSDYVGKDFATQARAMHEGTAPERAIYGEAKLDEAKALIEDGVPVAPLPFNIGRKTN
ncbi:DUF1178 family protein [Shimia haliotis]|uniref:DUF1178 family protein n=1 Tax=Shimia haliotis TaxID=1280847 RepID=A0A1I4A6H2_9RHOB|nr:DUF1178 family protein [Shimia haliotis]SFK51446.1 hypothetical protein SAMN04488036_101169 [Shimia haliotis]